MKKVIDNTKCHRTVKKGKETCWHPCGKTYSFVGIESKSKNSKANSQSVLDRIERWYGKETEQRKDNNMLLCPSQRNKLMRDKGLK